uniref:Outer dense fiber of sperm tails 3 like 2 n=1 Tax=Steinernema glaseri TaxID=37863 RepID=A0A1I8A1R7_9BILA
MPLTCTKPSDKRAFPNLSGDRSGPYGSTGYLASYSMFKDTTRAVSRPETSGFPTRNPESQIMHPWCYKNEDISFPLGCPELNPVPKSRPDPKSGSGHSSGYHANFHIFSCE